MKLFMTTNKQREIYLKQRYGRENVLVSEKYPSLFTSCIMWDIPYDFINRCYKRYIKAIKEEELIRNLISDGYKTQWFKVDKDFFGFAIKIFLVNHSEDYEHFDYKKYSRGDINLKIADISGFSKYINLYNNRL